MVVKPSTLTFLAAVATMALAMLLAWFQLLEQKQQDLPTHIAARAGELSVTHAELRRAINGVNTTRRELLNEEEQLRVLQRLVDEKLLLQYGLDLGLAVDDPAVRKALVQSVMASMRGKQMDSQPSDEQLQDWYQENANQFVSGGQWRVRYFRLAGYGAEEKAKQLAVKLKSGDTVAEPPLAYVPDRLLPLSKLRDYLGASIAEEVSRVSVPSVLGPLALADTFAVVQVLAANPAQAKPLDTVRHEVVQAWQRAQGEQGLRDLLLELRQQYPVVVSPELL